jgi:hypothetical protein
MKLTATIQKRYTAMLGAGIGKDEIAGQRITTDQVTHHARLQANRYDKTAQSFRWRVRGARAGQIIEPPR